MIVSQKIAIGAEVSDDYVTFFTKDASAILTLDKLWLEAKSDNQGDWMNVINSLKLNVVIKQLTNGKLSPSQSIRIDVKGDPKQKLPIVDLNRQINMLNQPEMTHDTDFLIDIFLSGILGIGLYNVFLEMSFDDTQLEVIDSYDASNPVIIDGVNCRQIKAQVKKMDPSLEDYHDILWLCKKLQKKTTQRGGYSGGCFKRINYNTGLSKNDWWRQIVKL
jgi:hypothetical protein